MASVVTADELLDYEDLDMTSKVNGQIVDQNRTSGILFAGRIDCKYFRECMLDPSDLLD